MALCSNYRTAKKKKKLNEKSMYKLGDKRVGWREECVRPILI
jgi:hypothetical protein